ncbi:signal peptidase I [Vulcanimicrobium alpinum]|uniref:Signal peptidase I n=1 Tax=Vulcanimicrobium alpinum TaxID=3016050 RepID=A0AAN2C8U3_UNVUL|nr:signal peptidase I [Vulcanimicrobium alpinum]BDE05321.1 signal peptidase I [Vulcanimicrobium alpinum]
MTRARTFVSLSAQVVVLAAIAAAFFVRTPQVDGLSMEPRVHAGEFVLINTLAYRFGTVQRGDVVAFRHDTPTPETYIKRVVALPGEQVRVDRGVVSVNGRALAEPYVQFPDRRSAPAVTVPAGAYYVLGDNRADSDDSRSWGVLPQHDIVGKALVGIWPPRRI